MLELRPSCEHCDKPLPPDSTEARICSFECTFCADCVAHVLQGVCPNCGAGFVPRPIRLASGGVADNDLAHYPASSKRVFKPVDPLRHAALLAQRKASA